MKLLYRAIKKHGLLFAHFCTVWLLFSVIYLSGWVCILNTLLAYACIHLFVTNFRQHFGDVSFRIIRANTVQLAYVSEEVYSQLQLKLSQHEIISMAAWWGRHPQHSHIIKPEIYTSYAKIWAQLSDTDKFFLRYNLMPLGLN